jgi:hypothetical protein
MTTTPGNATGNGVPTKDSHVILVLGMHRSGTSAITRVLNLLGVDLGTRLLSPGVDNTKGFWESEAAFHIDEKLLTDMGRSWADVREMPDAWVGSDAASTALGHIVNLAQTEFVDSALWALKDPRLCRLAPLWLRAFELLGTRVSVVMIVRDPREVAESLHKRDGLDRKYSHLLWAQHVMEAEIASRGLPRVMLTYDELLKDWSTCMERVSTGLDISWPADNDEARLAIGSFLDAEDRHHQVVESNDIDNPLTGLTGDLYRLCGEAAEVGRWSGFAAFRGRYQAASGIFAPAMDDLIKQAGEGSRALREALDQVHAEKADALALCQAHIGKLDGIIAEQSLEITRLSQDITLLARQVAEQSGVVIDRVHEISKLRERVGGLVERNAALEVGIADGQQQVAQLEGLGESAGWLARRLLRVLLGRG